MWWILIIGACVLFVIKCNNDAEKQIKNRNDYYKANDLKSLGRFGLSYHGGYKNAGFTENAHIEVFENKIRIELKGDAKNPFIIDRFYTYDKILDIELKTEQDIKESISLGKLLVFGVFALGMKGKSKTISQEYIVLRVKENDNEIDLIFQTEQYYNLINLISQRLGK